MTAHKTVEIRCDQCGATFFHDGTRTAVARADAADHGWWSGYIDAGRLQDRCPAHNPKKDGPAV